MVCHRLFWNTYMNIIGRLLILLIIVFAAIMANSNAYADDHDRIRQNIAEIKLRQHSIESMMLDINSRLCNTIVNFRINNELLIKKYNVSISNTIRVEQPRRLEKNGME